MTGPSKRIFLASSYAVGTGRGFLAALTMFLGVAAALTLRPGDVAWTTAAFLPLAAVLFWGSCIQYDAARGTLCERVGWLALGITFARKVWPVQDFQLLLVHRPDSARAHAEAVLVGMQRLPLQPVYPSQILRCWAASAALMLRLDIDDRGHLFEGRLMKERDLQRQVSEVLNAERQASDVLPVGAMLFLSQLAPVGGVLFAGWSVDALLALYWIDLLLVGVFVSLRIRSPGLLLGIVFLTYLVGSVAFGFLAKAHHLTDGVWHEWNNPLRAVREIMRMHTLWPAILAMFAGHLYAYMRSRPLDDETEHRTSALAQTTLMRYAITFVAILVAFAMTGSHRGAMLPGVGAVVLSARAAFDFYAHICVNAPLLWSGYLPMVRAALAEDGRQLPPLKIAT